MKHFPRLMFVAAFGLGLPALADEPTTRPTLDAGKGRTLTLAKPLDRWLVTDGDVNFGSGRAHRLFGRPGGRPMLLEFSIDHSFRTPAEPDLRSRLQLSTQMYGARAAQRPGDVPRPPTTESIGRPIGDPATGYFLNRRNAEQATARYPWTSEFAVRADRGVLIGRLLHDGDEKAALAVLVALAKSELSPPPRRATTRPSATQRSTVRMVADETGHTFVIELPADQKAETRHFPRLGFGGSRPVSPGISLAYSTFTTPDGRDAIAFRDGAWPALEKSLARQRDPATRPAAFPDPVPFTDTGDARLAVRQVRTGFANAVYAYLVDGDARVSLRMEAYDDDADAAEMLQIARSARIERGTPTTLPAARPRTPPTIRPSAQADIASAPPMTGPPDVGCVVAPDSQSTLVIDLPWTPIRSTGTMPPVMTPGIARTVSFSRRLRCSVEWDFGTFAGPATEARDRDWARRQRALAANRPVPNDSPPAFTDSGDATLAVRTAESAAGRFVYGYLKHGDAIVLIRLQSSLPDALAGEDDLPTMLRILRTARIEPGIVRSRAATQPVTRPAVRAVP